jgi:hypothetical protein
MTDAFASAGLVDRTCRGCKKRPGTHWFDNGAGTVAPYCLGCLNRGVAGSGMNWPIDLDAPPRARGGVVLDSIKDKAAQALAEQVRPLPVVDLAELARKGVDPPELLCDRLLYRGCLHSLSGPPEAGKSTLAYWWAHHELADGYRVVIVDVEAGPEQVVERFLALGAHPDDLERLTYIHYPGGRWDAADLAGLRQLMVEGAEPPRLVLFDSIGVALAQAGKDENHVGEVQPLYSALLGIARDHGPAVVLLDHLAKDGRGGRYARGSGAKLQLVDVALMIDTIRPFDRQRSGLLRLHVSKDRRGYLARDHQVKVEVEDGRMDLAIDPVDPMVTATDTDTLPPAAIKLLAALRGKEDPQSIKELGDRMKKETGQALAGPTMRKYLNVLADLGLAEGAGVSGQAKRWWALRTDDGGVPGVPNL